MNEGPLGSWTHRCGSSFFFLLSPFGQKKVRKGTEVSVFFFSSSPFLSGFVGFGFVGVLAGTFFFFFFFLFFGGH